MLGELLRTKLYRPQIRSNVLVRPELSDKLAAGARGRLTLVAAPAGFGKSTSLSAWISEREEQAAWLSLDQEDNTQARFAAYLIAALQSIAPDIGQRAQSFLESPRFPPLENLFLLLINDLMSRSDRLILVLDNYHEIRNAEIHQATSFLLDNMPSQMHLVIASRADPPLPLARLRVRGQLNEIRQADLRFSSSETAAFFVQFMGLRLTPNEISLVDSRTEGWIASLQMAALAWKGKDSLQDAIASFSGSHKYVLDFLLDEVWRRQPEPVQTFLMRTAVLERLSAPLCDAVTGGEDGDGMLDLINRENLFLVNLDDERRWYRYHPLFAEFLARQLVSKMADVVGTLHERAARWYEKNQLLPMAVHHAMVAGDSGEYARLIGMAANEALTNGRLNLISSWLERIPEETIRSHHQLALTRATVLYMTGKNELAQDYIRAAAAAIDPEASQNDIARLFSVRAFVCFSLGEIVDGIRWANEAVNLVDESDNNLRADLCFNLAQARWVSGDLEGAVQSCRQAIAYGEASDNKFITCSAQGALLQIMRSQGRLAESISLGREMVRLQVDGQGEPLPVAGYIHVCLAQAEYETNALAEATDDVKRGIALCRQMGDHHTIVIAKILLARLHLANGEAGEALTTVRAIRPEANYMRFAKQLAALEVDIEMGRGNLTPADSWAKSIESFASSPSHHFMIPIYLTYARWLLARDQGVNAAALLAKLADMAQEGGWHRYMAPIIILQAIVSRSLGREELSLSLLAESVASAAPRRHKRPFLDELPRIRNQLKRVRDSAPEFVDSLLSTTSGRSNASAMDELIEPLNERETQILRLMAAGLSNPAIARELFLTVNTVKWYVKSLYQKLDVHNRMEAVSRARAIGRL